MSRVYLTREPERRAAIDQLLDQFDMSDFRDKSVAVKANYNSADPYPASTHPDTLKQIMAGLQDAGAEPVTLVERSGMGVTKDVLRETGATQLGRDMGFEVVHLEDLEAEDWEHLRPGGTHWERGFLAARDVLGADRVVQTCCLKTHRFGGHFTMSLKNSIGLIARIDPDDGYDYMGELHTSEHQREMIAEVNLAYDTDLIIMDGLKAFVSGGPETGELANPGVMLASRDRVALDAVGVAILRLLGTTPRVSRGRIYQQQQIKRAAELGIGAGTPEKITVVPIGEKAKQSTDQIAQLFRVQG